MLVDVSKFCFDGTFFTVPMQFHQLWTNIYCRKSVHHPSNTLPLDSKSEQLDDTLLSKFHILKATIRMRMSYYSRAQKKYNNYIPFISLDLAILVS